MTRATCGPCLADAREVADALRAAGDHAGAWGAATVANYLNKEPPFGFIGPPYPGPDVAQAHRAGYTLGARELGEVLLAIEWGAFDNWGEPICPSCHASQFEDLAHTRPSKHAPDCALDAALRKAGLR